MWDRTYPGGLHVAIADRADVVGIMPATADVLARLSVPIGYRTDLVNADGAVIGSTVGTGSRVRVLSSSTVTREYGIILFGDANGDGRINVLDLTAVSRHIMNRNVLQILYAAGSDANHDGGVNVLDLTAIARHIMGRNTISQ